MGTASAAEVDRLIAAGGSSSVPDIPEALPSPTFLVTIPDELNELVWGLIKKRAVKISRVKWVEEAIREKAAIEKEMLQRKTGLY